MLRDYVRTGTTDQKLMTSLLEKEVERMNLKQELKDKNEQIKSLEAQLKVRCHSFVIFLLCSRK